jgi:phenylalanyl-tRNA synthetase beta chain
MRVPLSWLLEYAAVPGEGAEGAGGVSVDEVARRLTAAGLEIEGIEHVGHDISGIVVAQVLDIEELTEFRKPVRYCRVSAGEGGERYVICGAANFAAGDRVALALPGATLPGGFEIGARKTYGKISDGMICSAAELGIGDDHSGILVLAPDAPLGADFTQYALLRDEVLDINVTPDKGYALSVRGVARELAIAFGVDFTDPADIGLSADVGQVSDQVYPASIQDPAACDRFVLREVRGIDPARPTPLAMRVRLARAGQRCVSLAVDVTNYLMLELGQPLHAFDLTRLSGPIVIRRAQAGERLETLDHVVRELDPDDILITDSSGPISMAGTMGGLATEVTGESRDLVIEAAHFCPAGTARMSRRHKLGSEASSRFARGVDTDLQLRSSARAAVMLADLGGGTVVAGCTHAFADVPQVSVTMAVDYPDRVAGTVYGLATVIERLRQVGCEVSQPAMSPASGDGAAGGDGPAAGGRERGELPESADGGSPAGANGGSSAAGPSGAAAAEGVPPSRHVRHEHGRHDRAGLILVVVPPSWRPDLTDPSDLAEEVIRLEGYERIPVRMPRAPSGRGLTHKQRMRRTIGRALAGAGHVEVISSPFGPVSDADRLQLSPDDPRRRAPRVANPIRDEEPLLRTSLLPGLLRVLGRNVGRGLADVALFEMGLVFLGRPDGQRVAPILRVDRGPTVPEVATLEAALPDQPLHVAAVLSGDRETAGWWGDGRPASWEDAVEAARQVLKASRVQFSAGADQQDPWHPGRCAAIYVQPGEGRQWLAGHAGELHPRVVQAFGLPERTCAMELDLSVIETAAADLGPIQAPVLSAYPVATQDVALVVAESVPAADVEAALVRGVAAAGTSVLLEDVRLFDVYTGEQAGQGRKSLAYSLRFRAPDRTLTAQEASAARDAAVAEAARLTGAVLRS